jgi:hypothetical protein
MSVQAHHNGEIAKTLMVVIAIVAFVIIMLTKVPEWMAPEGGPGAPEVGRTVK